MDADQFLACKTHPTAEGGIDVADMAREVRQDDARRQKMEERLVKSLVPPIRFRDGAVPGFRCSGCSLFVH